MKSAQFLAVTALLHTTLAQQNTYPPTSSQTSMASSVQVHTVSPTGSVARYPRPTPLPGSETYWPTTEDSFLMDMQVVEVAGSPVPTVIRLDGESVVTMESTDDAGMNGDVAPVPDATNEEVPPNNNAQDLRRNGLLHTCVIGAIAWMGVM